MPEIKASHKQGEKDEVKRTKAWSHMTNLTVKGIGADAAMNERTWVLNSTSLEPSRKEDMERR
jgi:hypothetical protein